LVATISAVAATAQLPSWVSCIVRFIARILSRFRAIAYTN
jgi:hypothetical protein